MNDYEIWLGKNLADPDLTEELLSIKGKDDEINDRFYRSLEFGTAGLRGVIGVGTNRMNIYTVGKATQGVASYLNSHNESGKQLSVAIAYDSRNKSTTFAEESAAILAANGIKAYLYKELMPVPALSFAVRNLQTDAGICVTASHNPAKYNGFKVYGPDGCQATEGMANGIMELMEATDVFTGIKKMNFEEAMEKGLIEYISEETVEAFISAVLDRRLLTTPCSNLKLAYTPLNGAGKRCVLTILDKIGVTDFSVVKEQSEPDGNFPTCLYPNPEIKEALNLGLKLAEEIDADILLATDPDCDRVGIAVKHNGEYVIMTGNEIGILMFDFICQFRTESKTMPKDPVAVTTIVSTDMVDEIAKAYGVEMRRVLTGFKYIGDVIAELESKDGLDRFLLGFEESCGYLTGGHARDKDAVNASMIICEMASYFKNKGKTLIDVITEAYENYGYFKNDLLNFAFEGEDGMKAMDNMMETLRENAPTEVADFKVVASADYKLSERVIAGVKSEILLPKSNVLEYSLDNGSKLIVRPSGTEPKIKIYLSGKGKTKAESEEIIEKMKQAGPGLLGM